MSGLSQTRASYVADAFKDTAEKHDLLLLMNETESSQKIRPRCEIIVQYVLPAIRAEMAVRMRDEGISQARIARILGVTPAAISQYVKSKRGAVGQDAEVLAVIDDYIEEYRNDPDELSAHLCDVCNKIKLVFDKRAAENSMSPACCS